MWDYWKQGSKYSFPSDTFSLQLSTKYNTFFGESHYRILYFSFLHFMWCMPVYVYMCARAFCYMCGYGGYMWMGTHAHVCVCIHVKAQGWIKPLEQLQQKASKNGENTVIYLILLIEIQFYFKRHWFYLPFGTAGFTAILPTRHSFSMDS